MQARLVEFGEIEVEKERYEHDVVIEAGKVRETQKRVLLSNTWPSWSHALVRRGDDSLGWQSTYCRHADLWALTGDARSRGRG